MHLLTSQLPTRSGLPRAPGMSYLLKRVLTFFSGCHHISPTSPPPRFQTKVFSALLLGEVTGFWEAQEYLLSATSFPGMDVLLTHYWSPCWLPLWKIMNMEELFCIYKTNVLFVLSPSYPKKDLQAFAWKAQLLMQPVLTQRTPVGRREIRSLCGDLALPLLQVEPLLCPPHSSHTLWRIHIWMLLLTTLKKLEFFNPQRPKRQWMSVTNIMLLILFFPKKPQTLAFYFP